MPDNEVTLAVLQTEMGHVRTDIAELRADLTRVLDTLSARCVVHNDHLAQIDRTLERNDERWISHRDDHKRENSLISGLALISSAVAAVAGIFVGKP